MPVIIRVLQLPAELEPTLPDKPQPSPLLTLANVLSEALTTWGVRHGDPTVDEDALTIIIPIFSRTPLKTHDLLSEFFRISPVYTATVTYAHPLSRRVVPTRGRSR